jgi:hypothetical protein
MSKQRKRHLQRQPVEEAVRLEITAFVGGAGDVDVERCSYDSRADDLLVWVRLGQPISGSVLELFRREVAKRMHSALPKGLPLDDWLVVIECHGEKLGAIAWHDKFNEFEHEAGET